MLSSCDYQRIDDDGLHLLVDGQPQPPALRHASAQIGDDLPDLELMSRCGFPVAVANAVPAVKRVAAYVTRRPGGGGAVGEVVELLLRKQRRWSRALLNGV